METSKRRQILTTNASPNFSFRGLRKKILLRFFVTTSVTLINCTLVSGNPVRARASLLWPQPAGPPAWPGLCPELFDVHNFNSNSISRKLFLNRLPAGQCTGVVLVHRARSTVEFLHQETPDFISLDLWPPISLHINTVEYKTWGCRQEHTRGYTWHGPEAATGGSPDWLWTINRPLLTRQ